MAAVDHRRKDAADGVQHPEIVQLHLASEDVGVEVEEATGLGTSRGSDHDVAGTLCTDEFADGRLECGRVRHVS